LLSFAGVYVSAFLNGIAVTLFLYLLHLGRKTVSRVDWKMMLAAFFLVLFPSIFVWNAVRREQLDLLDAQQLQIGNSSYSPQDSASGVLLSSSSFGLTNFISDFVMIWRCLIVWNHRRWVVLFPIFTWLSSSACIFVTVWLNTQSQAAYLTGFGWGAAGLAASLATNIMVTGLIVYRIVGIRKEMESTLGKHHATPYTSVIAMVVESAALYVFFEIIYLVNYSIASSPAQGLMLYVFVQIMAIAPLLMMVRVALGQATTDRTVAGHAGTHMTFAPKSSVMHSYSDTRTAGRSSQRSDETYNDDPFDKVGATESIGMAA